MKVITALLPNKFPCILDFFNGQVGILLWLEVSYADYHTRPFLINELPFLDKQPLFPLFKFPYYRR